MFDAPTTNGHEAHLLLVMADTCRDDGTGCWLSQATMAKRTRLTERCVRIKLKALEDSGLIRRGDQRAVSHLSINSRPVVWDLAIPVEWWGSRLDRINEYRRQEGREPFGAGGEPRSGGNHVPPSRGAPRSPLEGDKPDISGVGGERHSPNPTTTTTTKNKEIDARCAPPPAVDHLASVPLPRSWRPTNVDRPEVDALCTTLQDAVRQRAPERKTVITDRDRKLAAHLVEDYTPLCAQHGIGERPEDGLRVVLAWVLTPGQCWWTNKITDMKFFSTHAEKIFGVFLEHWQQTHQAEEQKRQAAEAFWARKAEQEAARLEREGAEERWRIQHEAWLASDDPIARDVLAARNAERALLGRVG